MQPACTMCVCFENPFSVVAQIWLIFFPYVTLISEVKHCSSNLSDLTSGCEMSLVASMFISSNAYSRLVPKGLTFRQQCFTITDVVSASLTPFYFLVWNTPLLTASYSCYDSVFPMVFIMNFFLVYSYLQSFYKVRDCSNIHNHEGTNARLMVRT